MYRIICKMRSVGIILTIVFLSGYAPAQDKYPERPIQMVIPYSAGSYTDICTRLMSDLMPKYLGQPVVPLNKAGGGGLIAGDFVVNSKPDGYTIGVFSNSQANPENLQYFRKTKAPYASKDLLRVANFGSYVVLLCVGGNAQWKSLKDLLEYGRNNPNKIKWGNTGTGNAYWLMGTSLAREAGVKMQDIPFQGDGEVTTALMGNHIDMGLITFGGPSIQMIEAKKIKPLCVMSQSRLEELPDVPTVKELGFKQTLEFLFLAFFVPKETPPSIITKLNDTVKKVTQDAEYKEKMKKLHMPIYYMGTKDFIEYEGKEMEKLHRLLKEMGYL